MNILFKVLVTFFAGMGAGLGGLGRSIVKPVMVTKEAMQSVSANKRVVQSILCGTVIGFICGFIGAGGGMMMLLICDWWRPGLVSICLMCAIYADLGKDCCRVCK